MVEDDGHGFAPAKSIPGHRILFLEDYATSMGGILQVGSVLGEGTTVQVSVPVSSLRSSSESPNLVVWCC